jgi:hypothetical protein
MLFRKRIKACCAYCSRGTRLSKDQILCIKRGVVSHSYACGKFIYDPCKRIPPRAKALNFSKYDQEDYSL